MQVFNHVSVLHQYPALTQQETIEVEKSLKERFNYDSLPSEYRDFLMVTNGCSFALKDPEEEVEIKVDVGLPFCESSSVSNIFGVWLKRFKHLDLLGTRWPELFASNENSIDFGVLPDNMMSIASEADGSGSLFAISTDSRDFGKIYYYYDQYFYTIARENILENIGYCYFDQKLYHILKKYGVDTSTLPSIGRSTMIDLEAIEFMDFLDEVPKDCKFEVQRIYFHPFADSFNDFVAMLKEV